MAKLTGTQKEVMNSLYKEYGLGTEDIFTHKNYKIITRQGIDKIIEGSGMRFEFSNQDISYIPYQKKDRYSDQMETKIGTFTSVKISAWLDADPNVVIETYGESSPYNTTNEYAIAMAEKRAKSRAALMLVGLYKNGFFGEDEADDFRKSKQTGAVIK